MTWRCAETASKYQRVLNVKGGFKKVYIFNHRQSRASLKFYYILSLTMSTIYYFFIQSPPKIRNSESQYKRMQKHLKILGWLPGIKLSLSPVMLMTDQSCSGQKSSKTQSFSESYQMLVLTGGGDTDNLLCRGDLQSNQTATLRNIGE